MLQYVVGQLMAFMLEDIGMLLLTFLGIFCQ